MISISSPIDRGAIHQQAAACFGYFDEWFDEAAFGNTNLKRDFYFGAVKLTENNGQTRL